MTNKADRKEERMEEIINVSAAGRINALNDGERRYQCDGEEFKRGNSWEYCHKAFSDCAGKPANEIDYDYLALQLAFYLASWGMYRGSSFLLELDYKIHIPAVKMMMEERYRDLFRAGNPFADSETAANYKKLLFGEKGIEEGIYNRIEKHYLDAHKSIAEQKRKNGENKTEYDPAQESDTLLTKILLGVYGCIPAYDRYFKKGISLFEKQQWSKENGEVLFHEKRGLGRLLEKGTLTKALEEYHAENEEYTFMKVVDMYFFSLGAYFEEGYDNLSSDEKKAKTAAFKEKIKKEYGP